MFELTLEGRAIRALGDVVDGLIQGWIGHLRPELERRIGQHVLEGAE